MEGWKDNAGSRSDKFDTLSIQILKRPLSLPRLLPPSEAVLTLLCPETLGWPMDNTCQTGWLVNGNLEKKQSLPDPSPALALTVMT